MKMSLFFTVITSNISNSQTGKLCYFKVTSNNCIIITHYLQLLNNSVQINFKDNLKVLGGRYNTSLNYEGNVQSGWIFNIDKEEQIKVLYNYSS